MQRQRGRIGRRSAPSSSRRLRISRARWSSWTPPRTMQLMADKRVMEQVALAAPSLIAEVEAQGGGGEGEVAIGQTLVELPLPQAAFALEKATVDAHRATPTVEASSRVESLCAVIPATPDEAAFLKIHNGALDPAVRSFSNNTGDNGAKPAPQPLIPIAAARKTRRLEDLPRTWPRLLRHRKRGG
ncbi:hypothetical protein GUJ93_ZPchr0014g47570 [Zizania palustris]|uniref:Uncharacterized protein n=1 Tax=Zizania palustris TaxID=103762 RepID=A0A8J5TEN1_ZIZPA|nr:hypothetical protein GUJ93_ZPchr0014g47570 [Zizania palustris]